MSARGFGLPTAGQLEPVFAVQLIIFYRKQKLMGECGWLDIDIYVFNICARYLNGCDAFV